MPIYSYECPECGHEEEQWANKASERHTAACSKCNKPTNLVPSLCRFKLTGTGWYVTDYPKEKKTSKKEKE